VASVRVSVDDSRLTVWCDKAPRMLEGQFRILFANVLGFEVDEVEQRYFRPTGADVPRELKDLLSYLEESGVSAQLDDSVVALVKGYESSERLLHDARRSGERLKQSPPKSIDVPGFKRLLKPYQVPATAHMAGVTNAANFSVPGSGKTTIALAAFALLRSEAALELMLVVCPRAAFQTWEDESKDCMVTAPAVVRITGSKLERVARYEAALTADIVVITYQMIANDMDEVAVLLRRRATMIVLDESHYVKRIDGGKWANTLLNLAPLARRRIILTGTPVPNGLEDLWSQIAFLWPDPTPLGSRDQYRYFLGTQGERATEQVQETLRPLFWRIKKSDLALPKPQFHRIPIPMERYQAGIYSALAAKVLAEVIPNTEERKKLREWRRARMTRLLQAATNPSLLTEYSHEFRVPPLDAAGLSIEQIVEKYSEYETPAKLDYALELVQGLMKKGHKVLLWTSFVHNIKTLERSLKAFSPRIVFGDIPRDEAEDEVFNRELMIHQFKTSDSYPLLIGNPAACAESISLHKICKHAIYVDRTFNGAHYFQSLDRIHRIGLSKSDKVHYYILQAKDTIDTVIDARLEEKKARMLRILEDDFQELELESPQEEFSEQAEEERDFEALIEHLKAQRETRLKA
jgi:SNF2 family DNA or RNA helicase